MKRYLLPVFAAGSLLFALGSTLVHRTMDRTTLPPAPPPESGVSGAVAAVGLVEAPTEDIQLSCAVPGLVTALYVKAGDHVRAGQKLFSVDDRDLQADLLVKRAALNNARAQLAKLEAEPRPEELPPLEAKVAEAKAQLADAEVQVKLIESVSDARAVKKEDVLRRRQNYDAAKARLAQAEKDLALTKAGAWGPDLAIGRTQVEQAEAGVRQDEVNIERLTTRAPIDGTILQSKVRLGQYAQCGPVAEPLMIFGGTGAMHVRADVDENDASRVKATAPAVAHVRGDSRISYPLEFVRFEPTVIPKKSLTGDSTERVDTRVLEVIYRFRDTNAKVYDGQQMDVFIGEGHGGAQ
jgi:multidrug resistance efflux pump